jgi:hypothetical protein
VNRDGRQLLAHAMASDSSVAWQCLSKRTMLSGIVGEEIGCEIESRQGIHRKGTF